MSKKSCPFLFSDSLFKNVLNVLDIKYKNTDNSHKFIKSLSINFILLLSK